MRHEHYSWTIWTAVIMQLNHIPYYSNSNSNKLFTNEGKGETMNWNRKGRQMVDNKFRMRLSSFPGASDSCSSPHCPNRRERHGCVRVEFIFPHSFKLVFLTATRSSLWISNQLLYSLLHVLTIFFLLQPLLVLGYEAPRFFAKSPIDV